MLQAFMPAPGKIEFREAAEPAVSAGGVLIKLLRIGVCGSDIHVWHGKHPYTGYPVVQGHEVCARVLEIGAGVDRVKVGDLVTVQPQIVCGECYPCKHGLYNICENLKVMGFQTTGMASERFVCDQSKVLPLPEGISADTGALIEPLAVAAHALRRAGGVDGKNVLIFGGGTIGNLTAQAAKAHGAKRVAVSELSAVRREFAAGCCIDAFDPSDAGFRENVSAYFEGEGIDLCLECVGVEATMTSAVELTRKGGTIVIVGVFAKPVPMDVGLIQDRELSVLGTLMYREEDYLDAISLAQSGKLQLERLITHRFAFRDYAKAYQLPESEQERAMKIMIDVAEE